MLSIVINTKNAEKTVKTCLESVKFADEIVVLDMKSEDNTLSIAQEFGARVFSTQDVGYVEPARNEVIAKAKGDWIFIIDADEELGQRAKERILKIVQQPWQTEMPVAYRLPRKNMIWGKWMEHTGWWPDYQLRLFAKGKVKWRSEIHSVPEVKGEVEDFPTDPDFAIVHWNYTSITQFISRMDRYSTIQAKEITQKHPLSQTEVFNIFFDEWFRRVFEQQGWRDNTHGLALSFLQSTSELVKVLKVWERQGYESTKLKKEDFIDSINNLKKSLSYWQADWKVQRTSGFEQTYWKIRRKLQI